jgi:hypothetical protein
MVCKHVVHSCTRVHRQDTDTSTSQRKSQRHASRVVPSTKANKRTAPRLHGCLISRCSRLRAPPKQISCAAAARQPIQDATEPLLPTSSRSCIRSVRSAIYVEGTAQTTRLGLTHSHDEAHEPIGGQLTCGSPLARAGELWSSRSNGERFAPRPPSRTIGEQGLTDRDLTNRGQGERLRPAQGGAPSGHNERRGAGPRGPFWIFGTGLVKGSWRAWLRSHAGKIVRSRACTRWTGSEMCDAHGGGRLAGGARSRGDTHVSLRRWYYPEELPRG